MKRAQDLLASVWFKVSVDNVCDHETWSAGLWAHGRWWRRRDAAQNLLQTAIIKCFSRLTRSHIYNITKQTVTALKTLYHCSISVSESVLKAETHKANTKELVVSEPDRDFIFTCEKLCRHTIGHIYGILVYYPDVCATILIEVKVLRYIKIWHSNTKLYKLKKVNTQNTDMHTCIKHNSTHIEHNSHTHTHTAWYFQISIHLR